MLRPAFFSGKDSFSHNVSSGVIFLPKALQDPEAWLVVVMMGAGLLITLSVHSVFFGLGVIMPVGTDVCVEDV